MTLILLLAALLLPPPRLLHRLRDLGPKTPRDGPPPRGEPDLLAVAADIDLYAACLQAGLTPAAAAGAVVEAGADPATRGSWRTVAALLAIGVPARRAWAAAAELPGLGQLAGPASLSGSSGAALSTAAERIAATLRDDAAARAVARAERTGVLIALPLTLCFLPAFLVLGLAPVVISLGTQLLT